MSEVISVTDAIQEGLLEDAYVVLHHSGDVVSVVPGVPIVLNPGDRLHFIYPGGAESSYFNDSGLQVVPIYDAPL